VIEETVPLQEQFYRGRGRIPYQDLPFFRAFIGKSFLQIPTTEKLIERLHADANFRRICGFIYVPSAPTFSRRFAAFADTAVMDQTLNIMVRGYLQDRIVGHILRDATAIEAREKPVNTKREVAPERKEPRKRGRPRKGESKANKKANRLAQQARQKASAQGEAFTVAESNEDKPGVILDYDKDGNLVSLEVLDASRRVTEAGKIEFQTTN
jgi:uncharacterized protein YuzE